MFITHKHYIKLFTQPLVMIHKAMGMQNGSPPKFGKSKETPSENVCLIPGKIKTWDPNLVNPSRDPIIF